MAPQLDQGSERRPQAVFFFLSSSRPLGLFMLLFRDASVLTLEVRGHSSTGAIPLLLPNALSVWFTTHTGPCHSGPTQPSLTLTCMWICRAALAGRRLTGPRLLRNHNTWDDTQKPPKVSEAFSLTSTVTQYLLEPWFYLTLLVKLQNKRRKCIVFQTGNMLVEKCSFSSVSSASTFRCDTVIISASHVIIV